MIQIYLNSPGEDQSRASYPYFTENGTQYLSVPNDSMLVVAKSINPLMKIQAFHDGQAGKEHIFSGETNSVRIASLLPLCPGRVHFVVTDLQGNTTESHTYVFLSNYFAAYSQYQNREYQRRREAEEFRRLAGECPPPSDGMTYDFLISVKLQTASKQALMAAGSFTSAAQLSEGLAQAAGQEQLDFEVLQSILAKAASSVRDGNTILDSVERLLGHARFYISEKAKATAEK
jgi:hypothetical protein